MVRIAAVGRFFGALVVVVVVVLAAGAPARAAESDPYYPWLDPPRDGSAALNRAINERIERGLDDVNSAPWSDDLSCREVSTAMTAPLWSTAYFYFASDMVRWNVDHVPRTRSEYASEMPRKGTYRHAWLLPLGNTVPLDPSVQVGDVLFGVDKLGHFFTNGARYLARFEDARAQGASVAEAEEAAVRFGVAQENTVLGFYASGIFSYADLEANWRGLQFFRGLCPSEKDGIVDNDGDGVADVTPRLVQRDGRWTLSEPFDIGAVVDPCWDETFATSAFRDVDDGGVKQAVRELCPTWAKPDIQERRARYRARGCPARGVEIVASMVSLGEAPDPAPWNVEAICAAEASTTVKSKPASNGTSSSSK